MSKPPESFDVYERPYLLSATVRRRNGRIEVHIPDHWPRQDQQRVINRLLEKLYAKEARRERLLQEADQYDGPHLTITTEAALQALVDEVNAQTFQREGVRVRIGTSRYSSLAYMNTRENLMTVSRFSLQHVPAPALRYLIIHELAHCLEANHSKRFWAHVARFDPDYKHQAAIIKALHARAVAEEEKRVASLPPPPPKPPPARPRKQKPVPDLPPLDLMELLRRPRPRWPFRRPRPRRGANPRINPVVEPAVKPVTEPVVEPVADHGQLSLFDRPFDAQPPKGAR